MEWSNENVIKFLELYQMHPCIWDPKNIAYKNKSRIRNAWRQIENQMGVPYTLHELRRKKESLMAAYRSYRIKIRKSELEGIDVYEPTWFAYTIMDNFLGQIYKYEPPAPVKVEERQSMAEPTYDQEDSSGSSSDGASDPLKQKQTRAPKTIKRKQPHSQRFNGSTSALAQQSVEDDDECLLFSKLVAIKLRKLPDERRDFVMLKINEVFYNECQERRRTAPNNATVEYELIRPFCDRSAL